MIVFFFCVTICSETGKRGPNEVTKMVIFDIDGTLRDEISGIPKSAKRAVEQLRERGILVYICTGRSVGTIPRDVLELEPDGIIAGGGCYISIGGAEKKRKSFSPQTIADLMEWMREHPEGGFSLETQETVFLNRRGADMLLAANDRKWGALGREEQKRILREGRIRYEDNMEDLRPETERVHKICFWDEADEWQELRERIGPHALAQKEDWMGTDYYELVAKGCDKGTAVLELCRMTGISPEEVIGFGDGKNDLDFLRVTGVSVAMENGAPVVKEAADSVCERPDQDGIYRELKRRKVI